MGNANSLIGILIRSSYDGKGVKQAETDLKGLDQAAGTLSSGLTGIATAAGVAGIVALGAAAAGAVTELARAAAQTTDMRVAFDDLARGAGQSGEAMLKAMREASGGMVSDAALVASANRAMLLGVADSGAELASLLDVARVRGQAMGLSIEEAFSDVVTGIGRMSPLILDNLGIVTGGQQVFDDYADSINKSADALTDAEKKQALLNKVIADTQPLINNTVAAGQDLMAPFEQFDASLANAKQSLGELFGPAVAAAAKAVAEALQTAVDVVDQIETTNAQADLFALGDSLTKVAATYNETVQAFTDAALVSDTEGMRSTANSLEMLQASLQAIAAEYNAAAAATGNPLIDVAALQQGEVAFVNAADGAAALNQELQVVARGAGMLSDTLRDTFLASTDLGQRGMGVLSDHLRDGAAATNELNATLANSPAVFSMFAAAALAAGVPVADLIGLIDQASGALGRLQGARDSAVSGLASQLAGQVERGLISQSQATQLFAEGVDQAEASMQGLAQAQATGSIGADEFALAQALAFQTVDDGAEAIDEADRAAQRYSRTLSSDATKAAREAEQAFNSLKGEVSGVLSDALSDIGGVNPDEILGNLGLREDAIAENARRLADIAANGFKDQDWLGEFAAEVPDIFKTLQEAGDPRAAAAQMLKEFQSGFRPELLDRDLLKDVVRERLLSNQAKEDLATELATELAAEMSTSIPDALKTAREALGVGGEGGTLAVPEMDTTGTEAAGQTAGAAFGAALTTGIADAGTAAIAKLGEQLKSDENLKLAEQAGSKYGERWGMGLLATVQDNVPTRLIDLLVNLVTPGVNAKLNQQASLTGAR